MHVFLDSGGIFFRDYNILKTCIHPDISTSQSMLCAHRSSRWAVRGSNMSVGQQRWLWGSPVPWCQMTFPDSAPCHFTRERASPFLPQQKVECVYICHLKAKSINFCLEQREQDEHLSFSLQGGNIIHP